jgi:hypothetical protein
MTIRKNKPQNITILRKEIKKDKERIFKWYSEIINNQMYDTFWNPLVIKIDKVGFG